MTKKILPERILTVKKWLQRYCTKYFSGNSFRTNCTKLKKTTWCWTCENKGFRIICNNWGGLAEEISSEQKKKRFLSVHRKLGRKRRDINILKFGASQHLKTKRRARILTQFLRKRWFILENSGRFSLSDFQLWKVEEEKRSGAQYVSTSGTKKTASCLAKRYFVCRRSGKFHSRVPEKNRVSFGRNIGYLFFLSMLNISYIHGDKCTLNVVLCLTERWFYWNDSRRRKSGALQFDAGWSVLRKWLWPSTRRELTSSSTRKRTLAMIERWDRSNKMPQVSVSSFVVVRARTDEFRCIRIVRSFSFSNWEQIGRILGHHMGVAEFVSVEALRRPSPHAFWQKTRRVNGGGGEQADSVSTRETTR